jgi:hypothetical protein
MIEPVALDNFFMALFSGAAVLLCGVAYAVLFAVGRVYRMPRLMPLAYLAYGALAVAVLTLSTVLNFSGSWEILTLLLLVGYLLAPHGIWRLCLGTHAESQDDDSGVAAAERTT